MWLETVKEAKKKLGISCKAISVATAGKLSERDVIRLLGGEYKKPFVDDVIALGAALKLTPQQLFDEGNVVMDTSTATELSDLRAKVTALNAKIEALETDLAYKNDLLKIKDELLEAKNELLATYRLDKIH